MPLRQDGTFDLALVKAVDTYAVYLNGVLVFDHIVLPAAENDGPLLVGCRASENGERTDFGAAQVCCLEVYMQTLSPSEIAGWIHDILPLPSFPLGFDRNQIELLYKLPEQFIGGGAYLQQDHVDTGISLFDDPGTSFTLMARLVPQPIDGENNVYFSCFAEEADRWRGLLLRGESDRSLSLLLGQVYNLNIPCSPDSPLNLCVQKDRNVYTVYVDGKLALDHVTIDCDPYDGTLLVGCEETLEGAMFRKSATRVSALELFSGILPEEDVLAFDYQDAPLPAERTATSVAYQLPQAFLGDGESNAVDTGVRLFDVPEKSWTVDCVLLPNYSSYYDVYISCFNEESFSYSGLLLRQEDQGKITVYLGQLETIQVSYSETDQRLHFVIVKSGSEYAVYVNGQLAGQVDSPCHYYDGSLLIGCEQEADGTFFRYSKVKILTLNVTDEVLVPQDALNLSKQSLQSGRFD